ncbi:MAG: asparagine synthase (glutamine-hydrolyzing) [Bacteroidetes bacterium GWE2_29_8]|nr:MAG: asparagine synthase (glutamine-hydrolyzing) [Bacteroidetes bacterium GWE2_29_8]
MCGITGIYSFNEDIELSKSNLTQSLNELTKRGPDSNGYAFFHNLALGHCRLSIIDTSSNASQPFFDETRDYVIVYNGECFNYKELQQQYLSHYDFTSSSDTEVILQLYKKIGVDIFNVMNGFWSLAIYDIRNNKLIISRDRYGEKPLYYYNSNDFFAFASELKSLLKYPIPKEIDYSSLYTYFQLTYIPAPNSILKNVFKLNPGHFIEIKDDDVKINRYYQIDKTKQNKSDYDTAKNEVRNILEKAVEQRLIADVPIGTFLSGGIDSSIVTALASKHIKNLNTFSIGFSNNKYFDETSFAEIIAKKYNTNHTVITVNDEEIYENIFNVLDYIDEPFADSSAIPLYILSKNVSKHIKVALSGDGADELFAGYNKHRAEYIIRNKSSKYHIIKLLAPLFNKFKGNRNTKSGDFLRKISKFNNILSTNNVERYLKLCSFTDASYVNCFVLLDSNYKLESNERMIKYAKDIKDKELGLNDFLLADMKLVLPNDMLYKVDMMSMANSLEVRSPFMDYNLIDYVNRLPSSYKINSSTQKLILKDSCKDLLPRDILKRSKHGFEIPLLNMFAKNFKSVIEDNLLEKEFIINQGIFDYGSISKLKESIFNGQSNGDLQSFVWSIIVFQYWWKKYFEL